MYDVHACKKNEKEGSLQVIALSPYQQRRLSSNVLNAALDLLNLKIILILNPWYVMLILHDRNYNHEGR